jgi:hypothetical protein
MNKLKFFRQIVTLTITTIISSNCSANFGNASKLDLTKDSELIKVVEAYMNREIADKGFGAMPKEYAACAYEVLGSDVKSSSLLTVYLWTFCKGKFAKEKLPEYGSLQPVALDIKIDESSYQVLSHKIPGDAGSPPTVQEIFPSQIQAKIPTPQSPSYASLKERLESDINKVVESQKANRP